MTKLKDLLTKDWKIVLENTIEKEYFNSLDSKLNLEIENFTIYPSKENIFNAFHLCPFQMVKVVILGQDPYHQAKQAHGLSFSVSDGIAIPPSLKNIFKEIDLSFDTVTFRSSGNLSNWAKQGVLLLNTTLTVRESHPNSHAKLGWSEFTLEVIKQLNSQKEHLVFMLWGNFAQQYEKYIDASKHVVLKAAHPSPLAANKGGWFGNGCFKICNDWLLSHNNQPINWSE